MQCSSGFDLGLASYEEVKLGLSDQTFLVENGRQHMSNQLGLLSNFSRVSYMVLRRHFVNWAIWF
jgi:hypothetical protein